MIKFELIELLKSNRDEKKRIIKCLVHKSLCNLINLFFKMKQINISNDYITSTKILFIYFLETQFDHFRWVFS